MPGHLNISVRKRLVLGLSALAFLTICATVVAAITFVSHREKLQQIVAEEVPTLLLAAELAHAGEAIASGVAPVATAGSLLEVETISGEIVDKFAWMDKLIQQLNVQTADPKLVRLLREERANIQGNFLQLQAIVNTYWHVRSRNGERLQAFLDLLKQESQLVAGTGFDKKEDVPGLARIERSAALSLSLGIVAQSARGKGQAKAEFQRLNELIKGLQTADASGQLIDASNRITDFSKKMSSFLSDRKEEADLNIRISETIAYHKHLSDRLTSALSILLGQRKSAIEVATGQAENALTVSSILLVLLSILSLVMVAAIAVFLDRSISARLGKLQDSMKLIASGEHAAEIPVQGKDEIGEMGRAMSTFVNTLNHQQRSLRRAKNEAVSANRAKSLFLANVSHELRTPLNAILGFSEIIRTGALGPAQPSRYSDYANDIHESGQHLLDLINDVLDMAKIEAGKTELHETSVNVSIAIHDSLRIISQLAREAHIAVETDISPVLPSLLADSRMIVQMCTNLIENAVDYSPPGSTVTISARVNELGQFVISVEDRGMGMSPSEVNRSLNPLEREDLETPRETDGTGLGLPLIVQYLKLHDGLLDIDSRPGEGTTVNMIFPAARVRTGSGSQFTVIEGSG